MAIHLAIATYAPAKKIFNIITDFSNYNNWLPPSSAFKGTIEVSAIPVKLGTTYIEPGLAAIRGNIIEFEEPTKVTLHQLMTMKPAVLGLVIDIKVQMTLREEREVTVLERDVTLGYPWALSPFKIVIDNLFRSEILRTIELLKKYVEGLV